MRQINTGNLFTIEVLDKHRAFWLRKDVDEPLVQRFHFGGFRQKPYPLSDERSAVKPVKLTPDLIDIPRLLGLDQARPAPIDNNKVNWVGPVFPEAWMESVVGCPVYASAFSCTAKPVTNSVESFASDFQLSEALQSPWLKVMDKVIETAVGFAGTDIAVRQLHMRGIIDMLAACIGEESLCLALHDRDRHLNQLGDAFTQLYIEVALRGLHLRPQWNGGYVSTWGLFAPGSLLDYQADASSMIAPDLYKEFFIKYDSSIISEFEHSIVHVHACGLHIIDALLQIDELNAIEISLDRETGVWFPQKLIDYCKEIQSAGKSVLIYGQLSKAELEVFLAALSPVGLAIFHWNECNKKAKS